VTVDEYLADKKPEAVALFRQFAELADACGESDVTPRKSIVYWKRKRVWAGAFCNGKKLELNIDLLRRVDHPLNLAVIPHTERVLTHRMRVTDAGQLDDTIAALLREACETVGPGTRTKSPS
jgi:Domain of unknown function (DUF5655)